MVKRSDKRGNSVYLSIGTNLGNRELNISNAQEELQKLTPHKLVVSPIYESAPWGNESLNPFLNCVIHLYVDLNPLDLLFATQEIEQQIGRTSKSGAVYQNRGIDIDILTYNHQTYDSNVLKIPHSLMVYRKFVLLPLVDLNPEMTLPHSEKSVVKLLSICNDSLECKLWTSS